MEPEVVLNLWYISDQSGIVLSLKGRAHVAEGTDKEKLAFLHSRALLDYLIAEDFPVPEKFKTSYTPLGIKGLYMSQMNDVNMQPYIFKDCLDALEKNFSKLSGLKLSGTPLMVLTPLLLNDQYKVVPFPSMKKQRPEQISLFDDIVFPNDKLEDEKEELNEDEEYLEEDEDGLDEDNMYEGCVRQKVTTLFKSIAENPNDYNISKEDVKLFKKISSKLSSKSFSGQYYICAAENFQNGEMASCEIDIWDDEITIRKVYWVTETLGSESQSDILYQSGDEDT